MKSSALLCFSNSFHCNSGYTASIEQRNSQTRQSCYGTELRIRHEKYDTLGSLGSTPMILRGAVAFEPTNQRDSNFALHYLLTSEIGLEFKWSASVVPSAKSTSRSDNITSATNSLRENLSQSRTTNFSVELGNMRLHIDNFKISGEVAKLNIAKKKGRREKLILKIETGFSFSQTP